VPCSRGVLDGGLAARPLEPRNLPRVETGPCHHRGERGWPRRVAAGGMNGPRAAVGTERAPGFASSQPENPTRSIKASRAIEQVIAARSGELCVVPVRNHSPVRQPAISSSRTRAPAAEVAPHHGAGARASQTGREDHKCHGVPRWSRGRFVAAGCRGYLALPHARQSFGYGLSNMTDGNLPIGMRRAWGARLLRIGARPSDASTYFTALRFTRRTAPRCPIPAGPAAVLRSCDRVRRRFCTVPANFQVGSNSSIVW
jgi:hypothetical protein